MSQLGVILRYITWQNMITDRMKMKRTKSISLTMLLLLLSMVAMAQESTPDTIKIDTVKTKERALQVYAEVKDHLTHDPIKGVKGELLYAADSTFADTLEIRYEEEEDWKYGYMIARIKQAGSYFARLEAEGYQTMYVPIDIKKLYKREQNRSLKTIYLRKIPKKQEQELDEVVVVATKLKFYMDGDTLVYDADAFNMAEGSMLDALLKKLPGVEVEQGGVIKVNGRQIDALLLNGKDFFDSDRELLLENMPTYMVKNIQSYERVPDEVKGTNREKSTPKELVMNVKLKKEYNKGWIANADVGGGATFFKNAEGKHDGKYLGRLFGMRFTDNSRLALFANVNNLNDYRTPGEKGEWSPLTQSEGLTKQVKVGVNYHTEKEDHYDYQGRLFVTYYDKDDANNTSSATFLDDGSTFGRSFYGKRSYDWEVEAHNHYFYYHREPIGDWLKYFQFSLQPYFQYLKWNNHTQSASVTLSEDVASNLGKAWMDSIVAPNAGELLKKYAINRTISRTKGIGHWIDSSNFGYLSTTPAHNDYIDFFTMFNFRITDKQEDNYSHHLYEYGTNSSQPSDFRNRFNPTTDRTRYFYVNPRLMIAFDEKHHHNLNLEYTYSYNYNYSNSPLYLLNKLAEWDHADGHALGTLPSVDEMLATLDANNSSCSTTITHTHTPRVGYNFNKYSEDAYSMLELSLSVPFCHESLDYQRGAQVDTLMRRNTAFLSPRIRFFHSNWKRNRSIQANYSMETSAPAMTNLLDIRDDSNPLYVTLGNPNLKNTRRHELNGDYRDKFGKTLFNVGIGATVTENAVASGFIYNKETGVRTVTPDNVNGNWNLRTSSGIDFPLDKNDRFRIKENISYNHARSVDLSGTNESLVATRSVVTTDLFDESLAFSWKPTSKMEYGINGKLNYQHSASQRESFTNINAFTYQYGVSGQVELPWNIQVSTDLTMYSRRGYSEASMNTNELVWNARLSKRLPKQNMTILFDGFDLLGNLSNVRRYINAQGRTETFYNVIPSYGLLHVIYRLNKEPKKK